MRCVVPGRELIWRRPLLQRRLGPHLPPTVMTTTDRFPRWFSIGDINAFFGLMLDNIGDMILMATLLVGMVVYFRRRGWL